MNLPALTLPKAGESAASSKALGLAFPVGGIIISLAILLLIVWPKFNQIKELKSSNQELETRAHALEDKSQVLASLDSAALEKQLVAAETLLPSDNEAFPLIREIEQASSQTGVLLNRVDVVTNTINASGGAQAPAAAAPQPGSAGAIAPRVQVKLTITSSYGGLLNFLAQLYSQARVVTVEDISVSAGGEGSQVRVAFDVNAFWKTLPTDLGTIEKPVVKLTDSEIKLLDTVSQQGVSSSPTLPEVPLGKSDLFAPLP